MLGQQAFERSGLGAPTATAALQDELEHHKQPVLDLTRRIEELGSGRSPLGRASITLQRRAVAELASIFHAAWLGRAEAVRAGLWG